MAELDMPECYWVHLRADATDVTPTPGGSGGDGFWGPYSLHMFGSQRDDPGAPPSQPVFTFRQGRGQATAGLWRTRIHLRGVRAFVEQTWHPKRGMKVGLRGIEVDHKRSNLQAVLKGIDILGLRGGGGRSLGSTVLPNFRELYSAVRQQWRERFDRRPRQVDIAAELGVDERTLRRYLNTHGIQWDPR